MQIMFGIDLYTSLVTDISFARVYRVLNIYGG